MDFDTSQSGCQDYRILMPNPQQKSKENVTLENLQMFKNNDVPLKASTFHVHVL